MTYYDIDIDYVKVYPSPNGLKVLILDGDKTMQVFYLNDIGKLTETS